MLPISSEFCTQNRSFGQLFRDKTTECVLRWHRDSDIEDGDQMVMVPTLHVLFSRTHDHMLRSSSPDVPSADLRDNLIAWIANEALGGDTDAAELALLAAAARVFVEHYIIVLAIDPHGLSSQSRNRHLNPLTLTISHFPAPSTPTLTPTLTHIFSLILPLVVHVPLSLDMLNRKPFCPQSIKEDLHSGFLQVPAGSAMIISEGGLREGKLVEQGTN